MHFNILINSSMEKYKYMINIILFIIIEMLMIFMIWFTYLIIKNKSKYVRLKSLIPKHTKLVYISDYKFNEEINGSFFKYLVQFDKLALHIAGLIGGGYNNNPILVRCDINDCEKLKNVLAVSAKQKLFLLIFIKSYGGDALASDNISKAMQMYLEHTKCQSTLKCVVRDVATSAGTIIALASGELYMSEFATLGPVDPQTSIEYQGNEHTVSLELYKRYHKQIINNFNLLTLNEFLIINKKLEYYEYCVDQFKNLNLVKKIPKTFKSKIINLFCENVVPHHACFSAIDLRKLGFQINPINDTYEKIGKILDEFGDLT